MTTVVATPAASIAEAIAGYDSVDGRSQEEISEPVVSESPTGNVVKSPIVGTFYASPAPDKESFVKVGQK